MASFMPRLWIANVEEALTSDDILFEHYYGEKSAGMFSRFLCELESGDILLAPWPIDSDYRDYMAKIQGWDERGVEVISTGFDSPHWLAKTVLGNSELLESLARRCSKGKYWVESFIETSNVVCLADKLGLPLRGTDKKIIRSGIIDDFNDKVYFKEWAHSHGIPVVPGTIARDHDQLWSEVETLGRKYDRLMLRKARYAGGAGNMSGNLAELMERLDSWHEKGAVLCEPFLDIVEVAGSLVRIGPRGIELIGIDRQIFERGGWCGFVCPFESGMDEDCKCRVEAVRWGALRLGLEAWKLGVRGLMNLDWAFIASDLSNPLVLECNMRHNGFGYVTELAQRYWGDSWTDLVTYGREGLRTSCNSFTELLEKLRPLRYRGQQILIEERGRDKGAIITNPPRQGVYSLAIFGPDRNYIAAVERLVFQALS